MCRLLGYPEIRIWLFGSDRNNPIYVMRRAMIFQRTRITQREGRASEHRQLRRFGEVAIQCPQDFQRIIHDE